MLRTTLLILLATLTPGLFPLAGSLQLNTGSVAWAADSTSKQAMRIVVPNRVKEYWQAVEISVLDHKLNAETRHTISIGETYQLSDSSLSLEVITFLPAFIMNGSQITTASNELKNPAAFVIIREKSEPVYTGWLFSQYPDACAYRNPRYKFQLTGYQPKP